MAEKIQARKHVHFHTEGSHCDDVVEGECKHGNVAHTEKQDDGDDEVEARKMMSMSIDTAVAIALHNFPEGLATFVAALDNPKVGAVLAVAIAIHNIPEGLCVALPIYYATGDRWKAFLWAVFSGLTEPLGAFMGWILLANVLSDTVYAVLFGMVAGMMVAISARELVPTANRYDPQDSVVTYAFITGMAVMALALVLFAMNSP
jgi:ZIP family zinc transporter